MKTLRSFLMNKLLSMAIITIVVTGLLSVSEIGLLQQSSAQASDNSNPVASSANTNQGYMEVCKDFKSAKECATGPTNPGEWTSNSAHFYNGPE